MKKLLIATAITMMLGTTALAQPQELTADETLNLRVGQSKMFQFDHPIRDLYLASENVASVHVLTDRVLTLTGIAPGSTLAIAYPSDGSAPERMNLTVEGQMVRVYGLGAKDFDRYMCDSTYCDRGNTDLVALPSAESITTTTDAEGHKTGTAVTKTYP